MKGKRVLLFFIIFCVVSASVLCQATNETPGALKDYQEPLSFDLVLNKSVPEYIRFFSPSTGIDSTEFFFPLVSGSEFTVEVVIGVGWSFNSTSGVDIKAKFYAFPDSSYFEPGQGFMLQGDESKAEDIVKLNYSVYVADAPSGPFEPLITMTGSDISSSAIGLNNLEATIKSIATNGAVQGEAYIKLQLNAPEIVEGSQYFMATVYSGYVIVETSVN